MSVDEEIAALRRIADFHKEEPLCNPEPQMPTWSKLDFAKMERNLRYQVKKVRSLPAQWKPAPQWSDFPELEVDSPPKSIEPSQHSWAAVRCSTSYWRAYEAADLDEVYFTRSSYTAVKKKDP